MKRWGLCASVAVFHQFHGADARACGAITEVVAPVLPAAGATDVPLDAALVIASNSREVSEVKLRRIDDALGSGAPGEGDAGEGDAGATSASEAALADAGAGASDAFDIEVRVECFQGPGARACVGKPASMLRPNSTYEWYGLGERPSSDYPPLATDARRFTTGTDFAEETRPDVQVVLTEYERSESHPCGLTSYARVAVSATGLSGPLVVHASPLNTNAGTQLLTVLTSSAEEQAIALSNLSACATLKGFDVTGRQWELGEVCPEDMGVGTPAPTDSTVPAASGEQTTADSTAPSDRGAPSSEETDDEGIGRKGVGPGSDSGCALAAGATVNGSRVDAAVWVLAVLGCLTLVRRRRR